MPQIVECSALCTDDPPTPREPDHRLTFDPADDRAPVWSPEGDEIVFSQYDVAPDGRFLIAVTVGDAVAAPITVIQHWQAGTNK